MFCACRKVQGGMEKQNKIGKIRLKEYLKKTFHKRKEVRFTSKNAGKREYLTINMEEGELLDDNKVVFNRPLRIRLRLKKCPQKKIIHNATQREGDA